EILIDHPLGDEDVHQGVVEGDVGAGLESAVPAGEGGDVRAARVHHDQLGAALGGVLEERRRHRVVARRVAAGQEDDIREVGVAENVGDGSGANAFEQGGDGRGVA